MLHGPLCQVLVEDPESTKTVGFLPRDLAQYLSPLMDKFGLCFEVSRLYLFGLFFGHTCKHMLQ